MIRFGDFSWARIRKLGQQDQCKSELNQDICPRRTERATLADIRAGSYVKIIGFCPGLPAARKAHLLAYGMSPGHLVQVVQHSPVTVVRIEHLELAMEIDLACEILVESPIQENLN